MRGLSREFGISRGRIRRLIERNRQQRETGLPLEAVQAKRASMLDQYKEYIAELLLEHRDPAITNQRILELIREKGTREAGPSLGITLLP